MEDEQTETATRTIGREWMKELIKETEDLVASQVGQAQHYLALARSRDARIHIENIMQVLYLRDALLIEAIFGP